MASTLDNALKLLGLENADDPALLWQNYMDRLGVLQTELIRATSESRQQDLQAQLAKLVAAYQLLRSAAQLKRSYATTVVRPVPPGARPPGALPVPGTNAPPSAMARPNTAPPARSTPAQPNSQTSPTTVRPQQVRQTAPGVGGPAATRAMAPGTSGNIPSRPQTRPLTNPPQAAMQRPPTAQPQRVRATSRHPLR